MSPLTKIALCIVGLLVLAGIYHWHLETSSHKEYEKETHLKMTEHSGTSKSQNDRRYIEQERKNDRQDEHKYTEPNQHNIIKPNDISKKDGTSKSIPPRSQQSYKNEQHVTKNENLIQFTTDDGKQWTATISSLRTLKNVLVDGIKGFIYQVTIQRIAATKTENLRPGAVNSLSLFVQTLQSDAHGHKDMYRRREVTSYLTDSLDISFPWKRHKPSGQTYFRNLYKLLANYSSSLFHSSGASEEATLVNLFYRINGEIQNINYPIYLMYLYLGNCLISENSLTSETVPLIINTVTCALTESETSLMHRSTDLLEITKSLSEKNNLCSLPKDTISQLEIANDATSLKPTFGSDFLRLWSQQPGSWSYSFTKQVMDFSEEFDGRVSELLMMYYQKCTQEGAYDIILNTPLRNDILYGEITDLKFIWKHNIKHFVLITFADGLKAIGKSLTGETNTEYIGDGLKELVGYHIDRLLLINRFPHTARRRIFFNSFDTKTILMKAEGSQRVFAMNNTNVLQHYLHRYSDQDDRVAKSPYIDIVFVGIMKSLLLFFTKGDAVNSLILKKDMNEMETLTRQTLRDIIDTQILDFLTHNFDRKGDNTIRSEIRYIPFDFGRGFVDAGIEGGMLCEWLLQKSHVLELGPLEVESAPHRNDIPVDCGPKPINRRMCNFPRRTVSNILRVGNRLSSIVKEIFMKEVPILKTTVQLNMTRIFGGLETRQKYLINYIEDCIKHFGDDVFI